MDDGTVSVYERVAPVWRERRGEASDGLGRAFRAEVGTGLIADLGCGAGRYLDDIGGTVVGLDASASMLKLAAERRHPLVLGDLEALPFATATLAGVLPRHSYLHLGKDRVSAAFAESRRVLRGGGFLLITLIEGDYEGRHLPDDDFPGRYFSCYRAGELGELLAGTGFSDISVATIRNRRGELDLQATARA